MFHVEPALLWTIAGLFAALATGTLIRVVAIRNAAPEVSRTRLNSLKTWWALAGVLAVAAILGELGIVVTLATAGVLSLREFVRLVGWTRVGTPTRVVVFASIPLYYFLYWIGFKASVQLAAPATILLVVGALRAWLGLVEDYIRTTAALVWGWMLFVYCLSHALYTLSLPIAAQPVVGCVGWFLYLVLLTEINDISQAIVGRRLGRTKITPRVSPNKSLEGLIGGMIITTILSAMLAPWLTNFMQQRSLFSGVGISLLSGLLISVAGFLGDIHKSGIKRDVGVKDGGTLLPGQGGMIDRVDSLTFSAPVFYYFMRLVA